MNVTVCIPTWNGERFIAETMKSVLAQTYEDFECLVVDDGSTDRTLDIVGSCNDSRIRCHVNPKQLGIANNYNRCLELARGEYVCVFQQDDLMLPNNLERKLAVLRSDPAVSFIHSSAELLTGSPGPAAIVARYSTSDQVLEGNRIFRELLLRENHICNPAVVARRQRMLEVGGYDPEADYTCDYEIWMKMSINQRVGFLADPLIQYRWHDTNSSHRFVTDVRRKQLDRARNEAMQLYRLSSGQSDSDLMSFALEQVMKVENYSVKLEHAKAWLEAQVEHWRRISEDLTQRFDKDIRERADSGRRLRTLKRRIKSLPPWGWLTKLRSLFGSRGKPQSR